MESHIGPHEGRGWCVESEFHRQRVGKGVRVSVDVVITHIDVIMLDPFYVHQLIEERAARFPAFVVGNKERMGTRRGVLALGMDLRDHELSAKGTEEFCVRTVREFYKLYLHGVWSGTHGRVGLLVGDVEPAMKVTRGAVKMVTEQ